MSDYKFEQSNKQIIQSYHSYSGDREQALKEVEEVYAKAKAFNEITDVINAPWIEYPEDWMGDVLKIVREKEGNN